MLAGIAGCSRAERIVMLVPVADTTVRFGFDG